MTDQELQIEWERQVGRLIELGYHRELRKSEATYRNQMPAFAPQPESYKGRFDIPLLVDPRLSLKTQIRLAGINPSIQLEKIADIMIVPTEPYSIWTHDGNRYRQFSVKNAISKFLSDEAPSPQVEVMSLFIQHTEIFKDHGVDATGSIYGKDNIPCIDTFFGRPELSHGVYDHPDSRWGTLSRGKSIQFATNLQG